MFETCANRHGSPAKVVELGSLAERLLAQAESEDRLIVSWSEHDKHLLDEVLVSNDQVRLSRRYRNAIKTASPWRQVFAPEFVGENALAQYMARLGWAVPEEAGQGVVGDALRRLRAALETT